MKLSTANRSIETGGMKVNVGFTIDMNAKAFSVLSDGMYTHAIPSIVRELSSNAYDSHVAAGTPELPFDVSCPNAFDPYFAVKDYGVGLRYFKYDAKIVNEHDGESTVFIDGDIRSDIKNITLMVVNEVDTFAPAAVLYDKTQDKTVIRIAGNIEGRMPVEFDDALVLYSTYFRSTKEDSNDFVGAFGLGSKTPFAYTDNFQVTNIYNGVMSVFNVYTDEHGQPQISIMGRFDTDEVNGLEVKIAVKSEDYSEFKKAIASELKYFNPLPTVLNDTVDIPKVLYSGKNFALMDRDVSPTGRTNIMLGNNSYNVYISGVDLNDVFRYNVALRFSIGELQPTSNREDLRIEQQHRELIQKRGEDALKEYSDYIVSTVNSDSLSEHQRIMFAMQHSKVIPINDSRIRKLINNPNYAYTLRAVRVPVYWGTYNEIEFVTNDEGVLKTKHSGYVSEQRPLSLKTLAHGMTKREHFGYDYIDYDTNVHIYIKDNSHAFMKKIRYHANENGISHRILVIDQPKSEQAKLALECLLEVIRNVEVTLISDIELPKNQTISTTPSREYTTPVGRMMPGDGANIMNGTNHWDEVFTPLTKIEQDEDMYIVEMFRNEIQNSVNFTYKDQRFLQEMIKNDNLDGVSIIALSTAKYEKALTYGFQPISTLVDKLKNSVVLDNGYANQDAFIEMLDAKVEDTYYAWSRRNNIYEIIRYFGGKVGGDLEHLVKVYETLHKRYGDEERWSLQRTLADLLDQPKEPSPSFVEALDNFAEFCDNVWDKVKMVKVLKMSALDEMEEKSLIEYANWKFSKNTGA